MLNVVILAAVLVTGALIFLPRIREAALWRAAVTPLASIIGSGFLILGPILDVSYGAWAPVAMGALCLGAWLLGAAIRFNIAVYEDEDPPGPIGRGLERTASWALAFAYVVSVAYYTNLFGAFAVSMTPFDTDIAARSVTTVLLIFILRTGWRKGFHALEGLEQISVSVKLAIIAGLIAGLAWYGAGTFSAGDLRITAPTATGWQAIALGFGLIVTVQGFETSRYLGLEYDAQTRIRSMRLAQLISTGIYMTYIVLIAYAFDSNGFELNETAIIDLMGKVAPVLPPLLVAAALAAQFSAAIADTSGSGGLVIELTRKRVSDRQAYGILVAVGIFLTWTLNVFEIVSYASRAFALYYGLQCAVASNAARRIHDPIWKTLGFAALAALALAAAVFGTPVE